MLASVALSARIQPALWVELDRATPVGVFERRAHGYLDGSSFGDERVSDDQVLRGFEREHTYGRACAKRFVGESRYLWDISADEVFARAQCLRAKRLKPLGIVGQNVNGPDFAEFYTWSQDGSDSSASAPIHHYSASDLSELDKSPTQTNDPLLLGGLASPLLLDEKRKLLIVKSTVFDAQALSKRLYTLPSFGGVVNSFREFSYAVDSERGWVATRRYVYELDHHAVVSRTASAAADQMFFDRDGRLWFFDAKKHLLRSQVVSSK